MKNILLISLMVFCNIFLLTNGFDVTLKDQKDSQPRFGWTLSKSRPFHYFKSIGEIEDGFFPVLVKSLPDGDGIWILRYKDFSHLPQKFAADDRDPAKSYIKYSSKAQLFSKITLKVLNVGNVELELLLGAFDEQKISLSAIENCTKLSDVTPPTNKFKWTTYEIHTNSPAANVAIEVLISHPKSFLMIDEIHVALSEPVDEITSDEKNKGTIFESGNFRVHCKSTDEVPN